MAGRPKGTPKTGGRKTGTPNKRRSIQDLCVAEGIDPFQEMIKIARNPADPNHFNSLKELCQYLEPKKKAVEHSIAPSDEELKNLLKERLAE